MQIENIGGGGGSLGRGKVPPEQGEGGAPHVTTENQLNLGS